ncbi:uncharacterized protein OCT59_012742 [Rhizophagus irregularis]|uniref:uncharacterized protein n=1 Tax=Rhizophagus irregularis TaxID=588596 RepID=UPI00331DA9A9|nr:hypothetical protein OCT59_012742 [Rhizophagus irregularis]
MRSKLSELTTPSFEVVGVDLQVCKEKYERLINTTEKVLEFLKKDDATNIQRSFTQYFISLVIKLIFIVID